MDHAAKRCPTNNNLCWRGPQIVKSFENLTLRLMHRVTFSLLSAQSKEQIYDAILAQCLNLTGASGAFLAMPKAEETTVDHSWCLVRAVGSLEPLQDFCFPKGTGLVSQAVRSGSTVIVGRYFQWHGRLSHPALSEVKEVAVVPIKDGDGIRGVMGLVTQHEDPPMERWAVDVLEYLGDIMTVAVRNVHIRSQLEQQLQERRKDHALRRKIERRLAESQKMEALGRMAQGIVHDFNNVLNLIEIHTRKAQQTVQGSESPAAAHLEKVLMGCQKAKAIVEQVHLLGKPQHEQPQTLCFAGLVHETLQLFRASLPPHVQLNARLPSHAQKIRGVGVQLERVVGNLLKNALDAMASSGGTLTVEIERIVLSSADVRQFPGLQPGWYVRLRVADTGPGISQEAMEHIFEPFFTTKGPKGTGLGLSVAYGIVKAHGGHIDVKSELGIGAVFDVYIPALQEGDMAIDEKPQDSTPTDLHLLLVEDDPQLAETLSSLLEEMGWKVSTANVGEKALSLASHENGRFSAVLCDYHMPGLHGVEVARRMRAQGVRAPIFILTGLPDRFLDDCVKNGLIQGIISKPVSIEALSAILVDATRHSEQRFFMREQGEKAAPSQAR